MMGAAHGERSEWQVARSSGATTGCCAHASAPSSALLPVKPWSLSLNFYGGTPIPVLCHCICVPALIRELDLRALTIYLESNRIAERNSVFQFINHPGGVLPGLYAAVFGVGLLDRESALSVPRPPSNFSATNTISDPDQPVEVEAQAKRCAAHSAAAVEPGERLVCLIEAEQNAGLLVSKLIYRVVHGTQVECLFVDHLRAGLNWQ